MPTILKDANIAAISLVDRGANLKKIFLFKRATDAAVQNAQTPAPSDELFAHQPIIKAGGPGDEWSKIYCVVAVPDEVDQQGDVWSAEEIEKAADDFVAGGGLINFMHETLDPVGQLVQSAVALNDMNVNGEHIAKGSWYIAVRPNDEMKQLIKSGQITGVSVQGSAQRVPVFTPGIDSPGTMLHTVTKSAARTLDGKGLKEGMTVHLASDVNQAFIVLGEHPETGKLVLGNVAGENIQVSGLDLLTPQTAQAKLEELAAEAPKPMSMQYSQDGQSPFASVYEQADAAQAQAGEQMAVAKEATHPNQVTLDGVQGVWKTIRGGRAFIATQGERNGRIVAGPDEIRGVTLEGLTKRTDLMPEQFEQPIVKDARGRRLHRGDHVAHLMDPSRPMPVVEVLPQGVVVEVEKDGVMGQSTVPPRQVAFATGPVGGRGDFADLANALIGDFDTNEVLRQALAQLGVHAKEQIEEAIASGALPEEALRALVKLVDGPADASDDANVEGTVGLRQGVGNHMFKSGSAHAIDVLVNSLNAEPEVDTMSSVEKALPKHDRAKCVAGGCANCKTDGEVEKATTCLCKEGAVCKCGAMKKAAFPGAAPPFGSKKKAKPDDEEAEVNPDDEEAEVKPDDEEDEVKPDDEEAEAKSPAFPGGAKPFTSKKKRISADGEQVEEAVSKHFVMGQPHEHPHDEKKAPPKRRLPGAPEAAPTDPHAVAPKDPAAQAAPAPTPEAAPAAAPVADPDAPKLGDKPQPQLGRRPKGRPFPGAAKPFGSTEKAGFPTTRNPDQPMGGKLPGAPGAEKPGEAEPKKPGLHPNQKAQIAADLQQVAASGDKELLQALEEMGVPVDQLDAVEVPDDLLLMLQEKFLNVGRTSQTPAAQAPGFGVGVEKTEALVARMSKAVAEQQGWEQKPDALKGPKRLPGAGQGILKGQGVRLTSDGAVFKAGGEVTEGRVFHAPDGQRYIAKSVTDTTVVGFAGGQERSFPRGQVKVPQHAIRKKDSTAGERLPFPDGLLADRKQADPFAQAQLVTVPGGGIGTVYSVDGDDIVVTVEGEGNMPLRMELKRSQVKIAKAGPAVGDFVKDSSGKAGEVTAIDGDTATVTSVTRDLKEVSRKVPVSDLTVISGGGSVTKSAAGGSMGGHSPKANGKIKYIVRSFGEWAGGKQSIAARRLLAEHPEIVGGSPQRANALAAWLKDQWAGTTKWRTGRKGGIAKAVAEDQLIYEELDFEVDENYAPSPEELDGIFGQFAEMLGHDPAELERGFDLHGDEGVEGFLDVVIGPGDTNVSESATTSADTSSTLDDDGPSPHRDDEAATGFARVREVFKRALGAQQTGAAPTAREDHILAALESLVGELESTAGEDDVLRKREAIVTDFVRVIDKV